MEHLISTKSMDKTVKMAAVRGMALSRILARQCIRWSRARHLSAIPAQQEPEFDTKHYPEHIVNIVNQIAQLTLVETAELNELLKAKLKIPDAPMMAMGAMPMAQATEQSEEVEEAKEQTEFTVKLTAFDAGGKVKLIKEIKNIVEGMNLVEAKKFVESVPQVLKENISKEDADKLKTQIEAVGGTVEIE